MPLKGKKRVLGRVNGSQIDDMEVDVSDSTDGRVLRARSSISSLPNIKTPKSPAGKQRKGAAKVTRRHSSRAEILADKKKSSAPENLETTARGKKMQAVAITRPRSANAKLASQKANGKQKPLKKEPIVDSSSEAESESSEESSSDSDRTPEPAPGSQVLKKKWASHGLYVGQNMQIEGRSTLRALKKNQTIQQSALPLPMYKGLTIMDTETDYVLPFNIFNLTPWVVPKPPGWKSLKRNLLLGDAIEIYRRNRNNTWRAHQSTCCACTVEDGCDVNCLNRIMYYECCSINCRFTDCQNRPFRDLSIRVDNDTWFNDGIEIILTEDKGYGLRAVRSFEPNQIIVEYCGEIITQEECDDRLNTVYKNNESYYLMEFDNSMVIDATRGSIARFVNHSCSPNCKMEKWMVAGMPRMALFAGDEGIEVGEELTYDYNFNWFSGVSTQVCRCGARNCRGSVGKRSDGKKNSPIDDDSSAGKGRKKKGSLLAKKVIRKKAVKASNAKMARQPLKAKATRANEQKVPKAKKGNIAQMQLVKPKGRRLSTTTVEKKSKRTVDEKESTTVSLKKTKSKVFKVTKTYSKKQITNSEVVRRTLVEEQPSKQMNTKKQKKSVDAMVKETLQPLTKKLGRPRKTQIDTNALVNAVGGAAVLPKKIGRPKKVTLMCPKPDKPKGQWGGARKKGLSVAQLQAQKEAQAQATREWSIDSNSDAEVPIKKARKNAKAQPVVKKPRKNAKATAAVKIVKKTGKRGIPPPKTKRKPKVQDPEDSDNLNYETEVEASILKRKRRPKADDVKRKAKNLNLAKGVRGRKPNNGASQVTDADLVYPSPTDSSTGKLESINSGVFYGLTGINAADAYQDMLYQRPSMPSTRPAKRQRPASLNANEPVPYNPYDRSAAESTSSDLELQLKTTQAAAAAENERAVEKVIYEPSLGQSAKRQRKSLSEARTQLPNFIGGLSGTSTPTSESRSTVGGTLSGILGFLTREKPAEKQDLSS